MNVRQDEKTDIVGDEAEPSPLQVCLPADPSIPMTTLEGCGTPTDQGHRTVAKKRHVPQGFTDNDTETKIMVSVHEGIPRFTLGGYDGADKKCIGGGINLRRVVNRCVQGIVCHKPLYPIPYKKASRIYLRY